MFAYAKNITKLYSKSKDDQIMFMCRMLCLHHISATLQLSRLFVEGQLNVYHSTPQKKKQNKLRLVLQGRPPHAEGGWTIKHSLMRFNLVNNVTWPFSWPLLVFSCLGLITGMVEAFSVKFYEEFNYVVYIFLF